MRQLASIRQAREIKAIEGADLIQMCIVDGWQCVVKVGEFKPQDLGIYFEIDSFLPAKDERFSFLSNDFTEFEGETGARLRTRKFKGQIAQGLFLPLSIFPEIKGVNLGDDVTDILGIKKWEAPIPASLGGDVKGAFPGYVSRSDQERVQNLVDEIEANQGQEFEVSYKLDGTSMTVYRKTETEGVIHGVCGRNWEFKDSTENAYNQMARKRNIQGALDVLFEKFGRDYAFQGELVGEGIQANYEKIKGQEFFVYAIFDINAGDYVSPEVRHELIKAVNEAGFAIKHVPVFEEKFILNHTINQLLELAEGEGMNQGVIREGFVYKRKDGKFSFKTISNKYLLKKKE
jgi:RNA ligase (TIGR02306 family)